MTLQILWFKRDLRLADHAALQEAAHHGPILPLVIIEPDYWRLPDTSFRQWAFWRGCIDDLSNAIAAQQGSLMIQTGDAVQIFEDLRRDYGRFTLWSHEETGNGISLCLPHLCPRPRWIGRRPAQILFPPRRASTWTTMASGICRNRVGPRGSIFWKAS